MPNSVNVPNERRKAEAFVVASEKEERKGKANKYTEKDRLIRSSSSTRSIRRAVSSVSREIGRLTEEEVEEPTTPTVEQKRKKRALSEETFIISSSPHPNYKHDTSPSTPDTTIYSELILKKKNSGSGGKAIKSNRSCVTPSPTFHPIGKLNDSLDEDEGKSQGLKSIYQSIQKRVLQSKKLLGKSPCVSCALPERKYSDLSAVSLLNSSNSVAGAATALLPNSKSNKANCNSTSGSGGGGIRSIRATGEEGGSNGNEERGGGGQRTNNNNHHNSNQRKTSPEGAIMKKDEMLENENETLRERVGDLEKKVYEQRDEILCLRATLADVLRRITNLEGSRGPQHISNPNSNGGSPHHAHFKENLGRLKVYQTNSDAAARGEWRRPGLNGHHTPSNIGISKYRRANLHQSTGSLHSADSQSSNGLSPSPSPSPYNRGTPSPKNSGGGAGGALSPAGTPISPNQLRNGGSNGNPSPLAKRWSSTSDFHSGSNPSLFSQNSAMAASTKDATFNAEEGTVKIFLRGRPINLILPTAFVDNYSLSRVATAPLAKLRLEWVYGYRGRDCRANLYYLPTGELVYFIAAVVVLYNVEEQQQRHYLGHNDDVKCLAIHPNKLIVATGQCAGHDRREGKAHVRIWNSVSLHTLHVIGLGDFDRSICCLSFSKADGGALLCVIDESSEHNISIWDWQKGEKGQKLAENKSSGDTVVAMEFHPLDKNTIISCGKGHISFWTFENCCLYKKLGIFDHRDKPKYVTCLAFTANGDIVSGDSSGNVLIWARGTNVVAKAIRGAHEGPVFSIYALKDGEILTGGGKDGRVVQWDAQLVKAEIETVIPEQYGPVRAITEGRGSQLIVGTTRNCILAGSFQLPFQPVVQGHTDELWGLAVHPDQSQFLTGGHDKMLVLWDSLSHTAVWSLDFDEAIQSACFSPDGLVIVVGTGLGHWFAISAETREILSHHNDGSEPIQVVRFSPDGRMLAIGSRDNVIYIYQASENFHKYNRIGRCSGHSSFITHFDWSADSTFIQSNSGDYEVLFWNASVCRQIPQSSQLRDTDWATTTCTLSPVTIGIWPENADGTDVNTCDRSHDKKLIATGDDFGKVKLFTYPVTQPKSLCHAYGGHSSHVTSVQFLPDDTRLVTTGGKDSSVIQWVIC